MRFFYVLTGTKAYLMVFDVFQKEGKKKKKAWF